jgi:hypothetical protein
LELVTNATVVGDTMKFVSDYSNNNKRLISRKENSSEESKEPDYDDEKGLENQGEEKSDSSITC